MRAKGILAKEEPVKSSGDRKEDISLMLPNSLPAGEQSAERCV